MSCKCSTIEPHPPAFFRPVDYGGGSCLPRGFQKLRYRPSLSNPFAEGIYILESLRSSRNGMQHGHGLDLSIFLREDDFLGLLGSVLLSDERRF